MDHRLKEFFCILQLTRWEGKFRSNRRSAAIRHIKTHVRGKRTTPVQERLHEGKLVWTKPLRSVRGRRPRLRGRSRLPNRLGVHQRLFVNYNRARNEIAESFVLTA